ncbi:MAG: beta-lactamase family protein [Lachnospiraceae bacterium]|nr:beta-lactamase family protein [Lachnospiraceae bacterium]
MNKKELMDKLAREAQEKGVFTGTWLLAEKGVIVSKGAVGFRDPEDKLPMQEDSLFDLASVTKQFTAAAVMLLRKKGLLSLEDEITKFYPEIPYKGVTIRHLLNHTGGLPDYMDWVGETAKKENTIPGNDIIVRFLCECGEEAEFAPGEEFSYSNTGYCLTAQIAEKLAGVPFEEFLQKNIFDPAGMTSTRVIHRRKDHLNVENLAYGLVTDDGKYIFPDDAKDSDNCVVPLDGVNGDGLVHSNIFDLFAWDRALREENLLTKEEQELMYTSGKLNNGENAGADDEEGAVGYGFGWDIFEDEKFGKIVAHSGGWPGYQTWYERFLDEDRVYILLCCRDALDERGFDSFKATMKAVVRGEEPEPIKCLEDFVIKDPDKSGWADFCGTYKWKSYRIEVSLKDGDLYGKFTPESGEGFETKMLPIGEKAFGMKEESGEIVFGEGNLTFYDEVGEKEN